MLAREPALFDEIDPEAEATADAEAGLAAGRLIGSDAMKAWLLSWGTSEPLTPPKAGD
jgi:predicted transcriptional regulator